MSVPLRWPWRLGPCAAAVLASAALLAAGEGAAAAAALAAGSMLALQALVHERQLRRSLHALRAAAEGRADEAAVRAPGDAWRCELTRVAALRRDAEARRAALEHAQADTSRMQEALHLSEQRYVLAVRGANDGVWEWDVEARRMVCSPRWAHMLGRPGPQESMSLEEWQACLHPEDRAGAWRSLQSHLDGHSERYDHSHRVRHADGGYRWVLSRGAAVRRASGRPYRVVGLDTDITRLKRVEALIEAIEQGTASRSGQRFYQALVMHLARALQVDCAFITECDGRPPTRARTLACWRDGGFGRDFAYDLAGTPCERVIGEARTCFHASGLEALYPCERGLESYLGLPILDRHGAVIGHLALVHSAPMSEEVLLESVFRIFTARAGVEIELMRALRRLGAPGLDDVSARPVQALA